MIPFINVKTKANEIEHEIPVTIQALGEFLNELLKEKRDDCEDYIKINTKITSQGIYFYVDKENIGGIDYE